MMEAARTRWGGRMGTAGGHTQPTGRPSWRRRDAARIGRGDQKATVRGGSTHQTGRVEGDGARRLHAPDGDGGGRFGLSAGLDQNANSQVETMMLTDAPLLYTPGQVNQLHAPGMKEMRHANRKLKHCLDPSSHDEFIDDSQGFMLGNDYILLHVVGSAKVLNHEDMDTSIVRVHLTEVIEAD